MGVEEATPTEAPVTIVEVSLNVNTSPVEL
jgi:hypothetical protein